MNDKTRKQAFLLVGLVVVLAAAVWYQFGGGTPAGPGGAASNPLAGTTPAGIEPVVDVRLDLLQVQRDAYTPPKRNPFRFHAPPPPAPRPVARQPEPSPPPPPPVPVGPPPPRPIHELIRYLGTYVRNQETLVVLQDITSGTQLHARAGDVIDGRYRLLNATPDYIDIAYLDGRGRERIRIGSGR
jgi:hypothetical protein